MPKINEKPLLSVVQTTGAGRPSSEELLRSRVPTAEWVANPSSWNVEEFIEEISKYLFDTYGIVEFHNRHAIAILAGHMDTYIQCTVAINEQGLLTDYNEETALSINKYLTIRQKVMPMIISLMNELGLTPKSKLTPKATANNNTLAKILKGPKG